MMTILVVDDNPPIRQLLVETLADEGYSVAAAANGRDALAYLHAHADAVGLILLDLSMPEMSGWGFLQARRADSELRDIPVLVLSAYPGLAAATIGGGTIGYLKKPWDMAMLSAEVQRLCRTGKPAA